MAHNLQEGSIPEVFRTISTLRREDVEYVERVLGRALPVIPAGPGRVVAASLEANEVINSEFINNEVISNEVIGEVSVEESSTDISEELNKELSEIDEVIKKGELLGISREIQEDKDIKDELVDKFIKKYYSHFLSNASGMLSFIAEEHPLSYMKFLVELSKQILTKPNINKINSDNQSINLGNFLYQLKNEIK